MRTIVCLLEEPSAKIMLEAVIPKITGEDTNFRYIVFEGKSDLEKHLENKIKHWNVPDSYFLVMRDKDAGDCISIKQELCNKVRLSGKESRTCVRIACHELESFYLGDLAAVEIGLSMPGLSRHQKRSKFREPDKLANASEELSKITQNKYSKIEGSRLIAQHLSLDGGNKSRSFNVLIAGIKSLLSRDAQPVRRDTTENG